MASLKHESPLGLLLPTATETGLSCMYFAEHKHFKDRDDWLPNGKQP
jgi:methylated-DNA-[protein]-cysteine S-methyltransferase